MPERFGLSGSDIGRMRHKQEVDIVRSWADMVETEVSRLRGLLQRGLLASDYREQRHRELASLLELLRRGLDPHQPRLFRGRVALEMRCQPRGHLLARVYPTKDLPILVPTIGSLPLLPERQEQARRRRSEIAVLRGLFPATPDFSREPWIERSDGSVSEDEELGDLVGDRWYVIRGLTFLGDRHRHEFWEDAELGTVGPVAFHLLCRCGERKVPTHEVMAALDAGRRVVTG